MIELTGRIKLINNNKGFGFISVENKSNDYYFKIRNLLNNVKENDLVIFLLENNSKGDNATAIRKVFENNYGLRFFTRVDVSHIYVDVDKYLPTMIKDIENLDKNYIEHKFDEVVGKTMCINVSDKDDIVYAKRLRRKGHSKLVLNKKPQYCKTVTCAFIKNEHGYLILTFFAGEHGGREPWDEFATADDIRFWINHALVFDKENIQPDTQTAICPW